MNSDERDVGEKLTELAGTVLDKALESDVSLDHKLDALKAVTALHLGLLKAKKGLPSDGDSEMPSLADMRKRLRAVGGES